MLHVPKTGGLSMLASLAAAGVPACVWGSGFEFTNCSCRGHKQRSNATDGERPCARRARAAVIEAPLVEARRVLGASPEPTLYLAVVRDPRSWFYSSMGQWCAGPGGPGDRGCGANATARDVAHWFTRRRACRDAEPHKCAHAKYYQHANLQSWFLEGVFMERNFAVCAMERAYATVRELLATAVRNGSDAEPAALRAAHTNANRWPGLATVRDRLPFRHVAPFYFVDAAMHERLASQPGGCLIRLEDEAWRERLRLSLIHI